ncbi:54S ribosomal protein L3, mitochondrial [Lachnellula subtilissima]|uniref:Large ribosomal subunit protein mL44 n=1 Tax=Lachnellula subtilissima TaxID=602034 RepID=A0A8H8RFH1_9HELO|nr:54S ribosomal protein L3, mitochondrial [Lachnellula subtilissima]
MKRLRLERWSGQLFTARSTPARIRPCCLRQQQAALPPRIRFSSSAAALSDDLILEDGEELEEEFSSSSSDTKYPSPPLEAAFNSSKLAALHARLNLSQKLPLQTMARTLVDPSADSNADFNNAALSNLGGSIMSYHVSEWLLCTYPRLPMTVLFAAAYAYSGPKTLQMVGKEWGVETAAAPGEEVDPGYLQFSKLKPGQGLQTQVGSIRPDSKSYYRRGMSSRVVYDDEFGDTVPKQAENDLPLPTEHAYASFVKAVVGSVYLHSGSAAAKTFVTNHILSRYLQIASLFQFREPVRELSRLCAREGFEYPVARIMSETGRRSRHPVFVVGIFSGADKLGEGAGPSLGEARTRACVHALKAWYLYSPGSNVRVPSEMEVAGAKEWEPVHIDIGEVIH